MLTFDRPVEPEVRFWTLELAHDPAGGGGADGSQEEGAKDEGAKDEGAKDEGAKDEGACVPRISLQGE
jgi:hypothetical protein